MASKRPTTKKKVSAPRSIEIDVDLGALKTTAEQQARLKAQLDSILLTWVKADVKEKVVPIIVIDHHSHPKGGEEGGNG